MRHGIYPVTPGFWLVAIARPPGNTVVTGTQVGLIQHGLAAGPHYTQDVLPSSCWKTDQIFIC